MRSNPRVTRQRRDADGGRRVAGGQGVLTLRILCVLGRHAYGDPTRGESYEFANFVPALAGLGHEVAHFDSLDRVAYRDFGELNCALVARIAEFQPDLVFCVLMHYEVWTETLDLIRTRTPAALLHWGTDDSWKFLEFSRHIARFVDVHATTYCSALQAAERYVLRNVVLSQWAASSTLLADPLPSSACTYDVSFVGAAYGDRRQWISRLTEAGFSVACFGHGWESGPVATDAVYRVHRQSRIALNFADSGLRVSRAGIARSRQIKARTFEVPGAGGFLLTQGAEALGDYLEDGREIAVFDTPERLVSQVRRYLGEPEARDRIARAGNARVRAEHTYQNRFPPLIAEATAAAARRGVGEWSLEPAMLEPALARHRAGSPMRPLGKLTAAAASAVWGGQRGPRAARRLFYEASWRVAGASTFSAAGLPGRLFYRES